MKDHDLLAEVVRERENYNGMHQAAVMEIDRLRAVLEQIATMDPCSIRADDLGRAARIAREALTPSMSSTDNVCPDCGQPSFGPTHAGFCTGGIPRAQPMPPYNFQEPDNGTNSMLPVRKED